MQMLQESQMNQVFIDFLQVFGSDHPKTKRSLGILNEPTYSRTAQQEGDTWPSAVTYE